MHNGYPVTVLDNGLKIVTHRMVGRDSVGVGLWVKVGSRYETVRRSGISHFIEHLVFKGTQTRTAQAIKEEIEGRGGLLNGFTTEDTTCYMVKMVKQHLPLALDVLTDMMQHPLFAPVDIERERTVILEEIKMYMDMPSHYAHDLINKVLWPHQPLGLLVSGDLTSVARISANDIRQFHQAYYHPVNTLYAVCADSSHDDIVALIADYFRTKKKRKKLTFKKAHVNQTKPRLKFVMKKTEQSHLVIGMRALRRTDPDRYALALLHIILGANMSSRLYEEVREKRGLAYEIRSGLNFYEDAGSFLVAAGTENSKVEETLAVILQELVSVRDKGVSADEVKRAQEYFINQLFFSLEDTLEHMLWLGDKAMSFATIPTIEEIKRRVYAVSADAIQRMAQRLFTNNNLNLVLMGPLRAKRQSVLKRQFTF